MENRFRFWTELSFFFIGNEYRRRSEVSATSKSSLGLRVNDRMAAPLDLAEFSSSWPLLSL